MERSSGILMHISSLPSKYGIGTLGKEAYRFADQLKAAGQKYWQLLPLGPTSYGDSPYASFSSYAGNPYYIDLDLLVKDKLLKKCELESVHFAASSSMLSGGIAPLSKYSTACRMRGSGVVLPVPVMYV